MYEYNISGVSVVPNEPFNVTFPAGSTTASFDLVIEGVFWRWCDN